MRMTFFALAAAAALCAAAPDARAFGDPDWPCVQRKVVRLGAAQMWTGAIPNDPRAWRADAEVRALASRLAARRTPLDEAERLIAAFAPDDAERAERLTSLFMGAFDLINTERTRIIEGITRFSVKQRALADKVDLAQVEIERLRANTAEDDFDGLDRLEEMEDAAQWDARIYQERRRTLTFLCESPVILERRAFALARLVTAEMEEGDAP